MSTDIIMRKALSIINGGKLCQLSASDWRILRTGPQDLHSVLRGSDLGLLEPAESFRPHHLKGGGKELSDPAADSIYNVNPELYAKVVLESGCIKLLQECAYNIAKEFAGKTLYYNRPPIRALIQDDNDGGDVEAIVSRARTFLRQKASWQLLDKNKNLWHLWFNFPGMLFVLLEQVGMGKRYDGDPEGWLENSQELRAALLFERKEALGFVCVVWTSDVARPFNADYGKGGHTKTVRIALAKLGASAMLFTGAAAQGWKSAVFFRDGQEATITWKSKPVQKKWLPKLAFFIPAECVKSAYTAHDVPIISLTAQISLTAFKKVVLSTSPK